MSTQRRYDHHYYIVHSPGRGYLKSEAMNDPLYAKGKSYLTYGTQREGAWVFSNIEQIAILYAKYHVEFEVIKVQVRTIYDMQPSTIFKGLK